ncbi:transcription initiation factor IIB 2 [Haladaptatus sp. R4]|nr:transcription initiation factor IIB 2 [Haladaptatus sp. R4]
MTTLTGEKPLSSNSVTSEKTTFERGPTSKATSRTPETEHENNENTITEQTVCPECGGQLEADSKRGETVCTECGLVVDEDSIDHGPEWRAFDSNERDQKSRVGAPTTKMMHDKGLSTNISWQNKDAYGNSLSARQRQKMQRLRTWNERFRTRDSKERNLKQALGEIQRMSSALGLSKANRETASVVYRRALDEDLLPGRSIEGVATAAVYAAIRQTQTPRTLEAVAQVSRVDELEFKRAYRYINRELGLEIGPPDAENYIASSASELAISDTTERQAHDLLRIGKEAGLHSGRNPVGLAAAAIYAAALLTDEKVTQDEVSAVTDVSTVTIRNRYQELLAAASECDSDIQVTAQTKGDNSQLRAISAAK